MDKYFFAILFIIIFSILIIFYIRIFGKGRDPSESEKLTDPTSDPAPNPTIDNFTPDADTLNVDDFTLLK
jgi:hypothetical protein